MTTAPIEEQLRRYGKDLVERDRSGGLSHEPTQLGAGARSSPETEPLMAPDARHQPYIRAMEVSTPDRRRRRYATAAAAAAVLVVALATGGALLRGGDTTTTNDISTSDTAATSTSLPTVEGPVGPYALPPTGAESVEGLVDADFYAIRFVSDGSEFLLIRGAMGLPPTPAMTSADLTRFLDGRGKKIEVPALGTVHVTCGDGGQLTDNGEWSWWSAAVGYWLQDGYLMSLSLVGTGENPQTNFDQDGNAVAGAGLSAVPCPEQADGNTLRNALSEIRTVGRTELDGALDSMPLTIGKYGRDIAQPR